MTTFSGVHHVALTVTDLDRSVAWYAQVFGMSQVMAEPHAGGRSVILRHPQSGLFLGLHVHDGNPGGLFSETITGLDHVCFAVSDPVLLEQWRDTFERLGVVHSPIAERAYGSVLVFRDPDGIQLELITPAPAAS